MESPEQRIQRLQNLLNVISMHDPRHSFSSLVEENQSLFREFKVTYSSNNIETNFLNYSLSKIEKKCTTLKKFFYGSGLLFYSDDIYKCIKEK